MIKAKFTKTDDHFTNLEISGHAEYAEYGKDIVCSAVTAAFSTTINLIDRIGLDISYNKMMVISILMLLQPTR